MNLLGNDGAADVLFCFRAAPENRGNCDSEVTGLAEVPDQRIEEIVCAVGRSFDDKMATAITPFLTEFCFSRMGFVRQIRKRNGAVNSCLSPKHQQRQSPK